VNVVDVVREIVYYTLLVFWLLLVARVLTELARLLARSWVPTGWASAGLESSTPPPTHPCGCCARSFPLSGSVGLVWICRSPCCSLPSRSPCRSSNPDQRR